MKLYVCGDTHIPIDIEKLNTTHWPYQRNLCKDDLLVVLGDFGLLWAAEWTKEELYWAKWLTKKKCTVCFIDGNHENHYRLNNLPEDTFHGGKVGVAYEDKNGRILHLKRGEIFDFGGKKVFTMGGADSIDKKYREEGISWWKEEIPSIMEEYNAMDNLKKVNNEVEYIFTHTAPNEIVNAIAYFKWTEKDHTRCFLDWIWRTAFFKKWYFGHMHIDKVYADTFFCLYNHPPMRIL